MQKKKICYFCIKGIDGLNEVCVNWFCMMLEIPSNNQGNLLENDLLQASMIGSSKH